MKHKTLRVLDDRLLGRVRAREIPDPRQNVWFRDEWNLPGMPEAKKKVKKHDFFAPTDKT
jgi:hypothetical protein